MLGTRPATPWKSQPPPPQTSWPFHGPQPLLVLPLTQTTPLEHWGRISAGKAREMGALS